MKTVTVGGRQYRIVAAERDGRWTAHAARLDSGDRFGIEYGGATEAEAVDRLCRWLEWQSEHAAALEALQQAEQAYHRTIVGSAFFSSTEGPSAVELQEVQQASLDEVDAARVRLDEIRARKPE